MEHIAHIGKGGRLVIPAGMRRHLTLHEGQRVVLRVKGRELHLMTLDEALRRAQAQVRGHVGADVDLAEELIRERRAEAEVE